MAVNDASPVKLGKFESGRLDLGSLSGLICFGVRSPPE
jgi:hypothetical protein